MARNRSDRTSRRRGFSLVGLLIVALGALLLLNTTGVVGWGIWTELASYWPVLLALIGVKIILAPRAPVIGFGLICLILVVTVGAASIFDSDRPTGDLLEVAYALPVENTKTLQLGMGFLSGSVALSAYPTGLFAADFNGRPVEVIRDRSGDSTEIYLSTGTWSVQTSVDGWDASEWAVSGDVGGFSVGAMVDWDLMVSADVPVDIEIHAGAADLDLDLHDLNVRSLVIGAGASDIRISLPAHAGQTRVEISAGVADIEIDVPDGVAARVYNNSFLSFTENDSDSISGLQSYGLQDYATAENRVVIEIDGVAADITIG